MALTVLVNGRVQQEEDLASALGESICRVHIEVGTVVGQLVKEDDVPPLHFVASLFDLVSEGEFTQPAVIRVNRSPNDSIAVLVSLQVAVHR